jgi:hypothetical protein
LAQIVLNGWRQLPFSHRHGCQDVFAHILKTMALSFFNLYMFFNLQLE